MIGDINFEATQRVADEIKDKGGEALAIRHNVTDKTQWRDVAGKTIANLILVNNAGIDKQQLIEITDDDWNRVLDINLKGVFYGIQTIAPLMQRTVAVPLSTLLLLLR